MALTTTIGGASSDSFATLAAFQAYCTAQGLTLTGDDTAQESNLRRATAYLCRTYAWRGTKATSTQALCWPRFGIVDGDGYSVGSDEIPQGVIDAQCEMAYVINAGADPFATLENGAVVEKSERVDVISETTKYAEASGRDRPAFPAVDQLVAEFVTGKAGASGSMRAVRA